MVKLEAARSCWTLGASAAKSSQDMVSANHHGKNMQESILFCLLIYDIYIYYIYIYILHIYGFSRKNHPKIEDYYVLLVNSIYSTSTAFDYQRVT